MATVCEDESEYLTTDACASPPRDESTKANRIPDPGLKREDHVEDQDENENKADEPPPTSTFKPRKPKSSSKKPSKVYTNVINITNGNGIHIGTNVNLYLNKQESDRPKSKPKNIPMTENIRKLFVHKETVTRKDILILSSYMDDGWRDTARLLDYTDPEIYQFQEDHKSKEMKEMIYQFLLDWIQNNAEDATVDKMATALWECNQKEAVSIWSQKIFSP